MRRLFAPSMFAALLLAGSAAPGQRPAGGAALYEEMRGLALGMSPADVGLTPRPGEMQAYGALMDIDIDMENGSHATATVVAFASGDASLYLSSGGGTIGGSAHPPVAAAARAFVGAVTPAHLQGSTRVTAFPRPGPDEARFYLLTTRGVHMVARSKAVLETGNDPYSGLYAAGHEVITQFGLIDGSGN